MCTRPEKSQKKWIRDCELVDVENLDWESIYLLPRICTLSTKLRNFQFKFLHSRRIATNSFLFKIKFSESNLCCFVKQHKKRCFILSGNAQSQKPFGIRTVQQFLVFVDLIPASQVLTLCQCLGLKGEKCVLLFSHCLLLGRFYIYSCKYKNVRPSSIDYVNQVRCNLTHLPYVMCYADDTQLYVSFSPEDNCGEEEAIVAMERCIKDIQKWMKEAKLQLNTDKTELLLIGTKQQLQKINMSTLCVGNDSIMPSKEVKNLGVWLDPSLTMNTHINKTCSIAFYHLYNLRRIRKYLSQESV